MSDGGGGSIRGIDGAITIRTSNLGGIYNKTNRVSYSTERIKLEGHVPRIG